MAGMGSGSDGCMMHMDGWAFYFYFYFLLLSFSSPLAQNDIGEKTTTTLPSPTDQERWGMI